ncbi:kelch repeat-containing protein [Algoriphagus resistens]|uniref:kelch repeat-containing protein n=1 Tax=Algoriphagus resistens TaxID=1750590 RepID=UPI000716793E|nr:kelch repeat-containing protein [Algoriphagus resistens]
MEARKLTILLSFLTFLASNVCIAQSTLNSGLYFYSHEVIQDKRTSLNLTPDSPLRVNGELNFQFDVQFRDGDGFYGYIFKMLANDNIPIDLVSNLASETENFWLVVGNKVVASFYWEDLGGEVYNKWVKINLAYQPENNTITLSINDIQHTTAPLDIDTIKSLRIVFGASTVSKMLNTDVCPMTLKDVKIEVGKKMIRHWELKKHGENKVADLVHQDIATLSYPKWEIDEHLKWKKSGEYILPNTLGITGTPNSDSIFILGQSSLLLYTPEDSKIKELTYTSGNPYPCLENNFVYDPISKEIISYSFDTAVVNRFDLQDLSWQYAPDTCPEPDLWHHSNLFLPKESEIVAFSGYGHYSYKSHLNRLKIGTESWDSINFSESIPPRYLTATGRLDENNLLVFGGYGSQSGKQGINSQHYYDLYSLNLQDNSVTKLKEMKSDLHPFTPIADLISLDIGKSFVTLVYNNVNFNTYLKIAEFGISENYQKIYQDSIPYNFLDTRSWASMYYQTGKAKLIAVTRVDSLIQFYQIAYPPLTLDEAIQREFKRKNNLLIIGLTVSIIGLAILMLLIGTKNRKSPASDDQVPAQAEKVQAMEENTLTEIPAKLPAVYLMGGFQIFNSQGENQTGQFTPTLKALFLLIYLATIFDKKGISSDKLTELLWSDKSTTKARNNRNVNLSKIRLVLEKVSPSIQLTHTNSYWKIEHSKEFFSDLQFCITQIEKLKHKDSLSIQEIKELLSYTANGVICPSIQTDWMDPYKNNFSSKVLESMSILFDQLEDETLLSEVADTVLKFDPLNEEALKVKCATLFKMGKKSLALSAYKNFCKDYHLLLDQAYEVDFQDLVDIPD